MKRIADLPMAFMKGIKGKNVLITGASRGIGRAIAEEFAKNGANVIINYVHNKDAAERVKQTIENMKVKAQIIKADVSKEKEVINMIETAIETWGKIHILVNNAAVQHEKPTHLVSHEEIMKDITIDLLGAFYCSREIIKHFLKEHYPGSIINISSPHEIIPKPGFIGYSISKGGLKNLTRTLALEYAKYGIRVNAVAPGATITPMNKRWVEDPEKRKEVEKHIPLMRVAQPEEIAPSVVFLASDYASYITGITLFVDGGATLYPEYRENWSS